MLVETIPAVDRTHEPANAVMKEDDRLRSKLGQERKIVEARLLGRVVTVDHEDPDLVEIPVAGAVHELLRRHAQMSYVGGY